MAHFDWKSYFKPTPTLFRKIGDALLATSIFLTGYAVMMESNILALVILGVGAFGKFLSNFFVD